MTAQSEAEWFSWAINDPATYHATVFVSVAHRALVSGFGRTLTTYAYYHKGEAIKLVNKRLNDTTQALEDGTIAAISSLAAFEVVYYLYT